MFIDKKFEANKLLRNNHSNTKSLIHENEIFSIIGKDLDIQSVYKVRLLTQTNKSVINLKTKGSYEHGFTIPLVLN